MKRKIIYTQEVDRVWNKHTVRSKEFESLVKRQLSSTVDEELTDLPIKNFDSQKFTFVVFQNLLNKRFHSHLAYNSIQTIGHIKNCDGVWLYALSGNPDVRVKLTFACTKIFKNTFEELYARIYGSCKFYTSDEKDSLVHPEDCATQPYMEITVYSYVNLHSYRDARNLERDLYLKNYSSNKI